MINGTATHAHRDTTDSNTSIDTTSDTVAYTANYKIRCEKCDGTGYQQRKDGIWILCPICNGTGYRKCRCEPEVPYYPPYNPCKPSYWEDLPTYTDPQYRKYIVTC